jgi:hypothetical protein
MPRESGLTLVLLIDAVFQEGSIKSSRLWRSRLAWSSASRALYRPGTMTLSAMTLSRVTKAGVSILRAEQPLPCSSAF